MKKDIMKHIGLSVVVGAVTYGVSKLIDNIREKNISYNEGDENHEN